MSTLMQDVRYAVRLLLKQPGFTLMAVLTLALGIGANTAIFTVIHSVILKPLPYPEPERLVRLYETRKSQTGWTGTASLPNLADWRASATAFEALAAYNIGDVNLLSAEQPERAAAARVSPEYFSVLKSQALLGQARVEGTDPAGGDQTVVLSESLWRQNYGGDPKIVGKTITVDGKQATVAGVMPADFRMPSRVTQIWVPLVYSQQQGQNRGSHWVSVIGRLKPGFTVEQAQQQMDAIALRLEKEYPEEQVDRGVLVLTVQENMVRNLRPALLMLLGGAACLLLIACTNIANLQLARGTARRREMAVRAAIGAPRRRVLQQLLTESVLLSTAGGVLGLLVGKWTLDVLLLLAANIVPRAQDVRMDLTVLAFTFAIAVVTGVLFGLAPAIQLSDVALQTELRQSFTGGTSGSAGKLRKILATAQVAISLVLLVGAGLMIRSFAELQRVDLGIAPERVVTAKITLPPAKYETPESRAAFLRRLNEKLVGLPGAQAAGIINTMPVVGGGWNSTITVNGKPSEGTSAPYAENKLASPGLFDALGMRLLHGRYFTEAETQRPERVMVVNRKFVDTYLQGQEPLGATVRDSDVDYRIVGVVADVKQFGIARNTIPEMYIPYTAPFTRSFVAVVKTPLDATAVESALRRAIHELDPAQPIYDVQPLEKTIAESMVDSRLNTILLSVFAGIAFVLALLGIYSVMSYLVAQTTREIGIRIALGARPQSILKMVIASGMALAAIGVGVGLASAFALTTLIRRLLFGVTPTDPLTYAVVPAALLLAAAVACLMPARRAMRVDPLVALRYE